MTQPRILIVDDDASVRDLLRTTFPNAWVDVLEAEDGREALALVEADVPSLVLLDWKMPGASGAEVLAELKERHPELPVIVLTAQIQPRHRREAEALGADVFLTKPFSPIELLETVERLLAERSLDQAP